MGKICREVETKVREEVWEPVEEWVEKTEEKCKRRKWYDPRRWFCWLVTTLVKVVTMVLKVVWKVVVEVVCVVETIVRIVITVIGFLVDFLEWVAGLVIGAIGWLGCRLLGKLGWRKVRVCVAAFRNGKDVTVDAATVQAHIDVANRIFEPCKIRVEWSGQVLEIDDRPELTQATFRCPDDAGQFAAVWFNRQFWQYRALATSLWRKGCLRFPALTLFIPRPRLVVFYVDSMVAAGGCYVPPMPFMHVVRSANHNVFAHELGHALNLTHSDDVNNLMHPSAANTNLSKAQCCWARQGKFASVL